MYYQNCRAVNLFRAFKGRDSVPIRASSLSRQSFLGARKLRGFGSWNRMRERKSKGRREGAL